MASYNTHQRDPLLDRNLQALLQKRGRELLGVCFLVLAGVFALILGSYAPTDPSWMASTDLPVRNSLGRIGAAMAAPLMVIIGMAAWGLVLFAAAWGLRLIFGRGHSMALSRGVFLPIALAITAVWSAALVPVEGWDTLYGMGGVFGDTVLGAIVNALPMSVAAGVRTMAWVMFAATVATWCFVLGVDRYEVIRFARFVLAGIILIYAGLIAITRGGLKGSMRGAQATGHHIARKVKSYQTRERFSAAHEHYPAPEEMMYAAHEPRRTPPVIRPTGYAAPVQQAEPPMTAQPRSPIAPPAAPPVAPRLQAAAPPRAHMTEPSGPGLLARLKALSSRPAEMPQDLQGELVEPPLTAAALRAVPGGEARISSRIADAIRQRKAQKPVMQFDPTRAPLAEPPLRSPASAAVMPPRAAPQPLHLKGQITTVQPPAPMPDWMKAGQTAPLDDAMIEHDDDDAIGAPSALHAAPLFEPEAQRKGHVLHRRVVATSARKSQPSRRAQEEAEPSFRFDPEEPLFELPPLSLLENPEQVQRYTLSDEALEENARMLEAVLDDYGVRGEIVSVRPGPVVTQYELEPAPGLKASRVIGLADDIARSMSALSARVSTVPGRSIIGIELPNAHREKVVLREILSARDYGDTNMRLPLALGKGIDGEPIVANLAKMPHLLIAGTTGSGKSVAINTMILSLLYRLTPEECRMIMIDPKMLELSVYDGIPHLLSPVVTDPKKAVVALKWVVGEMEERYRKMSKMGVRNIEGYNGRVREALDKGEMFKRTIQTGFDDETGDPVFETEEFAPELLPFIVVVVDEMADLMMVAGKEIEACIQRLAQMARASGIHLIMATQRPSVDVITGTIKANFPTRISFQVTSKIDSRTILGEQGAEQLLGMGDMLYMAGGGRVSRIHGPFVSDEEVEEVVNHLKSFGPPDYKSGVVDGPEEGREADIDAVLGLGGNTSGEDALYDQAVQVVIQDRKCSTSYIQRKLGIGYNKAARLVEQMEEEGLVTPANHVGKREILVPEQG
jgi:S-DNA-T family DNA segregation ATPase FtsK/SpoIIIE